MLWRKDSFCRTTSKIRGLLPPTITLSFTFLCWMLPGDDRKLYADMTRPENSAQKWIVKPASRGEGKGIFVADTYAQVQTKKVKAETYIVQKLLAPHLIGGKKYV